MEERTLKFGVFCRAFYTTSIRVPANFTKKEAIQYAKEHMDELVIDELDYVEGGKEEICTDSAEWLDD